MWLRAVLLATSVATASAASGASESPALDPVLASRIDAAVRSVLDRDQTPSASIAIVRDGGLAYAAAYGRARLAPPEPATPQTRYQLASISKTLTAEALLLLEQDGRLSLDDPVSHWIAGLSGGDRVTLRQLLQHTAGFPDHYPQTYPAGPRTLPTIPDRIIEEWGRHPLLFEPGTRFRYSNLNYVIAGRIAERASGETLFGLLQRRVFTPLGMTRTVNLDEIDARTPDVATGYVRPALGALEPAPEEGRGWSFGAGQVVTTATDLARWDMAFLANRLLEPRQAQEEIATPKLADGHASAYALGLFVSTEGGRTVYDHVGQGLGFLAVNRLYPAERAAIVVLTNDSSAPAFARIAQRLAFLILPPTETDAQARALFTALQQNRLDRHHVSADLDAYFDARRALAYANSLGPLGEPDSFDLHSEDQADGLTTRVYHVGAGGRRLQFIVQLLADGRIESLQVEAVE